MIKVFNSNEQVFNSNGEKILHPTKAIILKEDNGDYNLELETSINEADWVQSGNILVVDTPWGEQGFRVFNPQKKSNKITCVCRHLFFDTENYLIKDSYVVDKTLNDALDHLNLACDVTTPFTTLSNVQGINTYRCVRKSLYEAINVLIERWGGHLIRNNFNITINSTIGQDNGIVLNYGKNISEFTAKENWDEVVTKILPTGKDGLMLPETYLYSNIQYDIPYTKTISFTQDLEKENYSTEQEYQSALEEDLRTQATNYLNINQYPKIAYTLKADVEKVTDVGDIIVVKYEKFNVNMTTNIISVKWDAISQKYIEINFGNFKNKLSDLITNVTDNTKEEINNNIQTEVIPAVSDKLNEAYDKIWNALGNSYCIYEGDKILIVDKLPKEIATNCIMINSQGIAFSQNGINGSFTSAWLIDGTLNMQAINVINLTADLIKGGTLKLGSQANQSGIMELYDEANKVIGTFDKNGLIMYAKDDSYITINPVTGFTGYDKNGNRIYWVDGEIFSTNKFIANQEINVGGKLRMLPINTGTNNGIGFVALVEVE